MVQALELLYALGGKMVSLFLILECVKDMHIIAFTPMYYLSVNQLLLMYQSYKNKNIFAFDAEHSEDLLVLCQMYAKFFLRSVNRSFFFPDQMLRLNIYGF